MLANRRFSALGTWRHCLEYELGVSKMPMGLLQTIRTILQGKPEGLAPQQIRDVIKREYPSLYGTDSHHSNVEKGHYKDLDHALLAQIYVAYRAAADIDADKSVKPMKFSLLSAGAFESLNSVYGSSRALQLRQTQWISSYTKRPGRRYDQEGSQHEERVNITN